MKLHPGWLAILLLLCSSCSRETGTGLRRLAILPPEILIDDHSSRWIRTALPIVWGEDLATAPHLVTAVVSDVSSAYQFGATEVLRTTVENRQGRLRLQGTITDASTQRNREVFDVQGSSEVLAVANEFAKRIDSSATTFSTNNERAFETFTRAFEPANPQARIRTLNDAISLDPGFGLAYILLVQTEAQAEPQTLPDLLGRVREQAHLFTALDRAKFDAMAAQATHAPLAQQETALRSVLKLAPNTSDALSGLASVRFLQGDAAGGERLMSRALELSPGNVNMRQQLALGLLETKRFAEAEKVLAGLDNNPAILPALATCVLFEGDVQRANTIAERFGRSLQPRLQPIYRASWLALSGNMAGAVAALEGSRSSDPNLESATVAELAIWRLMQNDFAGARQTLASAAEPATALTSQAILLSRADEPMDQWRGLVDSSGISGESKQVLLGYGLFLGGHYAEAADVWRQIVDRSGGADLGSRAMLAGSLDRAGNRRGQNVLVQPFVPEFGDLYAAISFGEMRRLLQLQVH